MNTHTSGAADLLMNTEAGRKYVADFFISIGRHDFADYIAHELAGDFACVLAHALAAGQAVAPVLPREVIRDVFMAHGFTVKEGQTDLKEYVYDAAYALLDAARAAQKEG